MGVKNVNFTVLGPNLQFILGLGVGLTVPPP